MKRILLLTGVILLITTSGCLVSDGRYHGGYYGDRHEHYEHREEVVVEHPAVVVRPEVVVRPPVLIVR
jgi:hypothetical protein